ncbi:Phage-related lysozyme [Candidatus Liberibacter americanus str. Sao Paulo]|uniref:Lysozyme n=1 Tax=Candidatus Liberibacter americanus str. Sao Paulo TaxID=1261131 RepID=U6B7Z9_9HYPH|nr:Phage-related lysozyme [Candidatus Liberibacter americanus str. Sao Paulo]
MSFGENRLSSIGDLVFKLGITRYKNITLRRFVNMNQWEEASKECNRLFYVGGKKLKGLVARRAIEAELLLKD